MFDKNIKIEKTEEVSGGYSPTDEKEKAVWDWYLQRKAAMQSYRQNANGVNVETIWNEADELYEKSEAKSEESVENLSDLAIRQAYSKVNIAQANLVDKNPIIVLTAQSDRYKKNNALMKALGQSSWDKSESLQSFKAFTHNMCRYGFAAGRTYHRKEITSTRFKQGNDVEEREITKVDEISFKNLSPFNVWLDEQTIPGDFYSTRDWMWRELWDLDDLKKIFPKEEYPNIGLVKAGGNLEPKENAKDNVEFKVGGEYGAPIKSGNTYKDTRVEVNFYENQAKDWWIVEANDVMVCWEMLPQDKKDLSLVYTWFTYRNTNCPYGVGIPEILKKNSKTVEKINNLTIAQLKEAICTKGFYEGTMDFEGQKIKLKSNEWLKVLPGTKPYFIQTPYPQISGILGYLEWLQSQIDTETGITKPIEGEVTGKTLGEVAIARESSLKRLKTPLQNLKWALDCEFKHRLDLIKQVYSEAKVERLIDEKLINEYLDEVKLDPKFYFWKENEAGTKDFYAKKYRTENLKLQEKNGEWSESNEDKFFHILPEGLVWEGDVNTKIDSILVVSEELIKYNKMQLGEILIKMLPFVQQNPELLKKSLTNIIKAYDEEPEDWLPEDLLENTPSNRADLMNKMGFSQLPGAMAKQQQAGGGGLPESPAPIVDAGQSTATFGENLNQEMAQPIQR